MYRSVHLQGEMQEDDHFTVTGLIESVLDVVVEDIHLVTAYRCETEAVAVRLEGTWV